MAQINDLRLNSHNIKNGERYSAMIVGFKFKVNSKSIIDKILKLSRMSNLNRPRSTEDILGFVKTVNKQLKLLGEKKTLYKGLGIDVLSPNGQLLSLGIGLARTKKTYGGCKQDVYNERTARMKKIATKLEIRKKINMFAYIL